MFSTAIKMLYSERKKAYNLLFIITITSWIINIFTQFFNHPYFKSNVVDFISLSTFIFKLTIFLFVLYICISLIIYACNHYNLLHAHEIGLVRLTGYSLTKSVLYQYIQTATIMVIGFMLGMLASVITLPLLYKIIFILINQKQEIFYLSKDGFIYSLGSLANIFALLALLQAHFIYQTEIPELMVKNSIAVIKKTNFHVPGLKGLYIICLVIGLLIPYTSPLKPELLVPSLISAFGMYGILKSIIPDILKKKMNKKNYPVEKFLVLSNYILYIESLKSLGLIFMLTVVMLSTMCLSTYNNLIDFTTFQLAYIFSLILFCFNLNNRFKLNNTESYRYYRSLSSLGMEKDSILKTKIKEIILVYLTLLVFSSIYLLNFTLVFIINKQLAIKPAIIIISELIIPFIISLIYTIFQEKRGFKHVINHQD